MLCNCMFFSPKKNILAKFDGQSRIRVSFLGQTGSVGQKTRRQYLIVLFQDSQTVMLGHSLVSSNPAAMQTLHGGPGVPISETKVSRSSSSLLPLPPVVLHEDEAEAWRLPGDPDGQHLGGQAGEVQGAGGAGQDTTDRRYSWAQDLAGALGSAESPKLS